MIPHKTLGSGISGTVRYVMGEGKRDPATGQVPELAPGAESRVAWYGGTGFGFPIDSEARIDLARRVMEWAAENQTSKTKRCRDDCLHLVLAWDPEERPDRAEMEAAAHSALKHLGMAHARAIFAAHHDTDHRHLHLVISRLDPLTGKAFPDRFDTLALSAWALQWERDHGGVRCEARLDRERQQAESDPEKVLAGFISRRETFTAFDLNRELTKAIPSRDDRRAFIGGVLARPEMVRLTDPENGQVLRYTTRQTLAAEHLAAGSAERLAAAARHQVSGAALNGVIMRLRADGKVLRDDQMEALRHATGSAGLAVIAGKAGTGKSFAMVAIAAAYQAQGYAVQSLAPTNKVTTALKRDGLDAATIHSLLGRLDRGQAAWTDRTVVMVDEAAMVSTRLMARLLSHAEHSGAKIILVGDDKQLASMSRGGLFGYLAVQYGAGSLDEITRQRGADQRELARRASQYDFEAALTALAAQGGLITAASPAERIAKAADLWGGRSAATPDASLFVIAVSNADAQAANLAIRAIRRDRGDLGPDHLLATADGLQAFAAGDRILFSGSAGTREGRAAGLVNGNAGRIERIEGARLTIALDGARPGETVSFVVGKDRDAGEIDAIRHAYAGTIFKAQGATYDHAIVIDSPTMRASSGYVALTRHRESVQVVTSGAMSPGQSETWMSQPGGIDALSTAQRVRAAQSYESWRAGNPAAGQRHNLADYITYVQGQEAARRAQEPATGQLVAEMGKRWQRIEDRRAASRFTALDYKPPANGRLTPAAMRATVGIEVFEQDQGQAMSSVHPLPSAAATPVTLPPDLLPIELVTSALSDPTTPPMTVEASAVSPPLTSPRDAALRLQADRQVQHLRHLGQLEEQARTARLVEQQGVEARAVAFRQVQDRDAEEATRRRAEHEAAEAQRAREGDIASASARYAIALAETYQVFDPYASLARAAMTEHGMMIRAQEAMRQEIAAEMDPAKRRVIELRMQIESCDYMAITSDRLSGISIAITGHPDAEQAVADRGQAQAYRDQAAALRTERSALIETIQDRVQVSTVEASGSDTPAALIPAQSAENLPTPEPSTPVAAAGKVTEAPATEVVSHALPASPATASDAPIDAAPRTAVAIGPNLQRPDVIAPPPSSQVTRAKEAPGATPAPTPAPGMPWLQALRQRVDEAAPPPGNAASETAIAKLARRLQEAKSQDGAGQAKDEPGAGPEPDL